MIKVGIVGARGLSVVGAMKAMPDEVKVVAMCDLDEVRFRAQRNS